MPDMTNAAFARAAVLEHETGALDVGAERRLELAQVGPGPGEVQHVREVVGEVAEVVGPQVDRVGRDPRVLELLPRGAVGEPGETPHLVVGREVPRQRTGDACRTRR